MTALGLKRFLPGYAARWRRGFGLLLEHVHRLVPEMRFGDDDTVPWLEREGLRFFGFANTPKETEQLALLQRFMPREMPAGHYRLVKDYVTRFLYPHMRPDVTPEGIHSGNWGGFHGQHKETLADYAPCDADGHGAGLLPKAFAFRPDDVVIDGGCFIGMGDIHVAGLVPGGHVYALEADAACHALLERNLSFNAVANVTGFHRAVWNTDTVIDLESGSAQANSLVSEVVAGQEKRPVRTISIDQLVAERDVRKVDMISLTLNGAEVEALEGAAETLRRFRPRVRLPGWYTRQGVAIKDLAVKALASAGYRAWATPRGNVLALHAGQCREGTGR